MTLPPCGLYRTSVEIAGVPAGRLVYFHNHGTPGPGIYLPHAWSSNRASFAERGVTLPDVSLAATLAPLAPEGLYRVEETFTCCENDCVTYEPGLLVQLGYNGGAEPLLFVPVWTTAGLAFPEIGQRLDDDRIQKLAHLRVAEEPSSSEVRH